MNTQAALPLAGRVAMVTGGGRGIGRSTAAELAKLGASVAVVARNTGEIDQAARALSAEGYQVSAFSADISDWRQIAEAVRAIEQTYGPVDILVNNAAILGPLAPTTATDPALWARTLEINITGAYYCLRAVLPGMMNRGWGHIVNITSGAAGGSGLENLAAYSVSKAALDMLTRAVAAETAHTPVRINGVSPGIVDTEMQAALRDAPPAEIGAATSTRFRGHHARGELQTPERPARLIAAVILSARHGEIISIRDERSEALLALLPQ